MSTSPLLLRAILVVSGLSWGATVSLATLATAGGHHPMTVALWSALVGLAVLTGVMVLRRRGPPHDRRTLLFYALVGLFGTALPHTLTFYAAAHLAAGPRAIVYALIPLMTWLVSLTLGLERGLLRRFAGLALGFAAVALLIDPNFRAAGPNHVFWMGVALGAAACYAVENVYVSLKRPAALDTPALLWGVTLAAVLWLTGALLALELPILPPASLDGDEAAVVAMALLHLGAYGGLFVAIRQGGAVFASQVSYIVTPAGVVWGLILLDEAASLRVAAATALVLLALFLIRPNPARASEQG